MLQISHSHATSQTLKSGSSPAASQDERQQVPWISYSCCGGQSLAPRLQHQWALQNPPQSGCLVQSCLIGREGMVP